MIKVSEIEAQGWMTLGYYGGDSEDHRKMLEQAARCAPWDAPITLERFSAPYPPDDERIILVARSGDFMAFEECSSHNQLSAPLLLRKPSSPTIEERREADKKRTRDKLASLILTSRWRPHMWQVGELGEEAGGAGVGGSREDAAHLARLAACMVRAAKDAGDLERAEAELLRSLSYEPCWWVEDEQGRRWSVRVEDGKVLRWEYIAQREDSI
jgi:hypothetical protein